MKNSYDPLLLLKRLVAIPSYVAKNSHESRVADFVMEYLKGLRGFRVTKHVISRGRYNIFVESKLADKKRTLFAAHLDTVEPKVGWTTDQFVLTKKAGMWQGLGALDTKGAVAAMLAAMAELKDPKNLAFLFYCDEEYDFLGMKSFLARKGLENAFKFAVVGEPSSLKIQNAHRGLIEISFSVVGKTGHAADASSGVNAVDVAQLMLADLREWLPSFKHPLLGTPSLNVAYIHGGLRLPGKNDGELGKQGNNIADFCEAVIDIRSTDKQLRAKRVIQYLTASAKAHGARLSVSTIRHDFGALYTPEKDLRSLEKTVGRLTGEAELYLNPSGRGYGDGQMIQEKLGIPVVNIGPRGTGMHAVGESVEENSLYLCRDIYREIMESA